MYRKYKRNVSMLIATITLSLAALEATAGWEPDCRAILDPLLKSTPGSYCRLGLSIPILSPYNDSRMNLTLLMLDKVKESHQLPTNLSLKPGNFQEELYFYSQSPSPFDFNVLLEPDYDTDQKRKANYQKVIDQLGLAELDEVEQAIAISNLNQGYDYPAVSPSLESLLAETPPAQSTNPVEKMEWVEMIRKQSGITQAKPYPANIESSRKDYLLAARQFHDGQLSASKAGFTRLLKSDDDWVKETAYYNLIRVALRQAQNSLSDEWGATDRNANADKALNQAGQAIATYLSLYPAGRYSQSSNRLKRRVAWLQGNIPELIKAFGNALEDPKTWDSIESAAILAQEVDIRFLFTVSSNIDIDDSWPDSLKTIKWEVPALAAAQILVRMRQQPNPSILIDSDAQDITLTKQPVSIEELRIHQAAFPAERQKLHFYLTLADTYYIQNNPLEVVRLTENWQDALKDGSYVSYSIAVLRVQALLDSNRSSAALELVRNLRQLAPAPMLKDYLELLEAWTAEKEGKQEVLFKPESAMTHTAIPLRVIRGSAKRALLKKIASSKFYPSWQRAVAIDTVLLKELYSGQFSELAEDYMEFGKIYRSLDRAVRYGWFAAINNSSGPSEESMQDELKLACPYDTLTVFRKIAELAPSNTASICLTDIMRELESDLVLDSHPDDFPIRKYQEMELGTEDDGFPVIKISRLALYQNVIADKSAEGSLRAYALYRALQCANPEEEPLCNGGKEIELKTRKAWFIELKTRYAGTPWSKLQNKL